MALSAEQILDLRDRTGDDELDGGAYLISDTRLNEQYTEALTRYSGDHAFDVTTVYVLRMILGKYARRVALSSTIGETSQWQQLFEHTQALLKYWEGVVGIAGGQTVTVSVVNAYRLDSDHTEEPDYDSSDDV